MPTASATRKLRRNLKNTLPISGMRTTPSSDSRLMMVMEMKPPSHAADHESEIQLTDWSSPHKHKQDLALTYRDVPATFSSRVLTVTVVRAVVVAMVTVAMFMFWNQNEIPHQSSIYNPEALTQTKMAAIRPLPHLAGLSCQS